MLQDLLHGKPLKHPLHPLLVHLPIGLFVLSLLFDGANRLLQASNELVRGAFFTMVFGLVLALVAAVPGFADWLDIRADHPAKRTATYHMVLNLCVVGLYIVNALVRYGSLDETRTPNAPLILSVVAMVVLSVSGYLGGSLVYDDGIAVGRYRRRTKTPRQTIRVSSAGQRDDFVPVADADSLGDQETLRAEVNGRVMTIVNLDGHFYAVQEFCTHRFGPLSEGTFHDGQVMCPWHRSCFDVRTGKVTKGPATVDLKAFEVVVREGKILVRLPGGNGSGGEPPG